MKKLSKTLNKIIDFLFPRGVSRVTINYKESPVVPGKTSQPLLFLIKGRRTFIPAGTSYIKGPLVSKDTDIKKYL